MPGQKQKKQVAQEPKKITLRERININEDTRIRIMKVSGMVAGVFAVFTFIAVLSYLFTWKADQSLLSDPQMMDKAAEVNVSDLEVSPLWSCSQRLRYACSSGKGR